MCLGVPGQIVAIDDPVRRLATVEIAGERRQVNIGCIVSDERPAAGWVGAWVLVHIGFAMRVVDAEEARKTLELLAELAAVQAQLAPPPLGAPEREAAAPPRGHAAPSRSSG